MKVQVLVKQVPDTETQIKISDNQIVEDNIKWILSPFDENALEETTRQQEKHNLESEVICLGPKRCESALRTALGYGLKEATHLHTENYDTLNVATTASILSAYCQKNIADIIICGHLAIDSQSSIIPTFVARMLDRPVITEVTSLDIQGSNVVATHEMQGKVLEVKAAMPVVVSVAKKINKPRFLSLKHIIAAKKKTIKTVDVKSYAKTENASMQILDIKLPPPKPKGRIIEGATAQEKAKQLVEALTKEAKVL